MMDLNYFMQSKVYSEIMHKFHYNIFNNYFYLPCNTTLVAKREFQELVACLFLLHFMIL
jgi:hypothetical protein